MEMDPAAEPLEWQLDVHLTVGMPLGISVVQNTGIITSIFAAGIIPELNERSPECAIQLGDRIIAINDVAVGGAGDAVELLRWGLFGEGRLADGTLRLGLCRPVLV